MGVISLVAVAGTDCAGVAGAIVEVDVAGVVVCVAGVFTVVGVIAVVEATGVAATG